MTKLNKIIQQWLAGCRQPPLPWYAVSHGYEGGSGLALGLLQLVGKGELGCLLLQLGELVLVLGNLFQCRLDAAIVKLSFMLEAKKEKKLCWGSKMDFLIEMLYFKFTYNFPLRSLTAMLSSLIWRKQF